MAETSPFLSYDTGKARERSAREEWQPHRTQTDRSFEWWYLTSLVHDAGGAAYFLFFCIFRYSSALHLQRLAAHTAARITPETPGFVCLCSLTSYRENVRAATPMLFIAPEQGIWDAQTSSIRLRDAARQQDCIWSFDGERLGLVVRSRTLSCRLAMRGAAQVMWAKDRLGKEGLIQQGAEEHRSFYYSLPRLALTGTVGLVRDGAAVTTEIGGFGWVDRQWGDFLTTAWEWASFRFDSGARLNLYHFHNGHQVGTYQAADGSTRWFDGFVVRQNGYARTAVGSWVSFGWSYELPIDVEGSRRFRLEPFSRDDMVQGPGGAVFYEGPSLVIDETSGRTVGVSVNESMDVRGMGNAPHGPRQR